MRNVSALATAVALVTTGLVLVGCSPSSKTAAATSAPREFSTSYTRFRGASVQVELRDADNVIYRRGERGHVGGPGAIEEIIPISTAQWTRFRALLEKAKIREWKTSYRDPTLADGEWWQVKLRFADISMESTGANMYPNDGAFDEFKRAVQVLIGDRPFP